MKEDRTFTCKNEDNDEKSTSCRVCLSYCSIGSNNGFSLFEKYKDAYIYEKINYIASIGIYLGDDLPYMICSSCLQSLESACSFKEKCVNSDVLLRTELRGGPFDDKFFEVAIKQENDKQSDYEFVNEDALSPSVSLNVFDDNDFETGQRTQQDNNFKSKAVDLKLECDDCGGSFKSKCKLRVHWKKVHQPKQLICPVCKKVLKTFKSFHSHTKKKSKMCVNAAKFKVEGEGRSRVFHCKECDAHSKRLQSMMAHSVTHTGERPYACSICNKTFTQHGSLTAHKENAHQIYSKEGTCNLCGKHFKGRAKFYRHMKTHTNAQLSCKVCNKLFKSKTYLKYHMQRHSGVKGFTCEICAKMFYTSSDLCNHKSSVHKRIMRKVLVCDLCQYETKNSSRLTQHRSKHTDDNVACEVCGCFVDNQHQLMMHKKRHFEKNFQCIYCNNLYYGRKNLTAHVRKKHNLYISRIESDISGIRRIDSGSSGISKVVCDLTVRVEKDLPTSIT